MGVTIYNPSSPAPAQSTAPAAPAPTNAVTVYNPNTEAQVPVNPQSNLASITADSNASPFKGVLGGVADAVLGSVKNFGGQIAAALGANSATDAQSQEAKQLSQNLYTAVQARNHLKALGLDTSKVDALIGENMANLHALPGAAQLYPHLNDTPEQVGGAALGTASLALSGATVPVKAAGILGSAAIGAGFGGAQGVADAMQQNKSIKDVAIQGTTSAAIGGAVGGAIAGIGKLAGTLGDKITVSNIKPSRADIADGFSVDTINKYDLGGSLNQTYNKTQSMLNDLTSQLNEKLADSNATINLQDVFQKTADELGSNRGSLRSFGFNNKIGNALEQLQGEVGTVGNDVSIPEAQIIKQSAGKLGAWTYGKPDPESSATEAVYTAFYRNLKNAIQENAPEGVKEINQQIGQLIPVQNALIRRMPVAERNAALSLTDVISLTAGTIHPSAFGLTLINRLAKSGAVGNALSNYISGAIGRIAPATGAIAGDVTSQLQSSMPTQ